MTITTTTKIIHLCSIKCDTSLKSQDRGDLKSDDNGGDLESDDDDNIDDDVDKSDDNNNNNIKKYKYL